MASKVSHGWPWTSLGRLSPASLMRWARAMLSVYALALGRGRYYGPRIFEQLGTDGFLFSALSGVVNFLSTIPAILLIDRVGRTSLLKYSAAGMATSCVVLALVGDTCLGSRGCAYLAAAAVFFFIFSFAFGWGPVVWVYCAELFPLKYRSKAAGLTTAANWLGNTCIGAFPPLLISAIGFDTFWVFGSFCTLCFVAACRLPETRNRSLEEVATVETKSV